MLIFKTDCTLVDTVANLSRRAHILKNMAQVLATFAAQQLRTFPSVSAEYLVDNMVPNLLPEAWEARSNFEFLICFE